MDENKIKIGKALKKYRTMKGYTQEYVSEITGLAPRYISQIERGFSSGSISTLIKLCDAYGITPNHVLYTMTNNPDDCSSYNSISNYNELNKKNRFIVDSLIDILIKQQGKKTP